MELVSLFSNKVFLAIILTFLIGQTTKILLDWIHHRRITFMNFTELGGMPSTHATVVSAMTTAVYLDQGVTTLFVMVLIISVIVIRDAVGVRLEVQNHAILLNKKFKAGLNENVGHKLSQVAIGVLFGIIFTALLFRIL